MVSDKKLQGQITLYAQNDNETPRDLSPSDQRLMYHYVRNYNGERWKFEAATITKIIQYIDDKKRENIGGPDGQHWNRVGLVVQQYGLGLTHSTIHELFLVPHAQAGEDWVPHPNRDPNDPTGTLGVYSYAVPPRERQEPRGRR